MSASFSYNKKEKLKSRKQIDGLFAKGRSFLVFPVKVFYLPVDTKEAQPVKAGVGVSARHFKKAVDRNRVKRLLRETYRLHKQPLYDCMAERKQQLAVFFLYIDKTLPSTDLLQKKMPLLVNKLIKALHETPTSDTELAADTAG